MTKEKQRVESLEEMVFKTRNKDYGAYVLRKKYQKYTLISLIIGVLTIGATVAYPIISAMMNKNRMQFSSNGLWHLKSLLIVW